MATIRRDFLKLAAGGVAGVAVSPLPWRLMGDSALWSQNWSWIPKTPRGEISYKPTACALCPAGCAVKARCAGAQPVSLWGATEPLCAAGLVGHHLAFHAQRLRQTMQGTRRCPAEAAMVAAKDTLAAKAKVAVLDARPGRTASLLYRKHLAALGGAYLTLAPSYGATLGEIAPLCEAGTLAAFDLDRTSILLSFGTPVLEAWGAPGRMLNPERKFKLWQAEARQSATALGAERWFRIPPGRGDGVRRRTDRRDRRRCRDAGRARSSPASGRTTVGRGPGNEARAHGGRRRYTPAPPARETLRAVACLNGRLKAYGRVGGIVARRDAPTPKSWGALAAERAYASVDDGSIGLLFIDDATARRGLPWKLIERKLAANAVVIAASWNRRGVAERATYALPAISYLEGTQDLPASPDERRTGFCVVAAAGGGGRRRHRAGRMVRTAGGRCDAAQRTVEGARWRRCIPRGAAI